MRERIVGFVVSALEQLKLALGSIPKRYAVPAGAGERESCADQW